ncbi:DUF6607 family protein [Psychroflexus montanilacus]|uniref:DUF6607 family protein n=1 Tax=Psychroflexus montanilacus TaxID=2873598 RepID=UPI001CCB89F2|nr:DUF6607 family protein [Psychroflexus montanilacus]MBZ9651864.1 hypothetical protein [Psychroflexus montanilacus]
MKTKGLAIATFLFTALLSLQAQESKKVKDQNAIKEMCGCYEVSFQYTETFSPEIDYEKKLDYTAYALEWAEIVEDKENEISIQHLLVINDSTVIKHWRQDWLFENNEMFSYDTGNTWKFYDAKKEQVEGQWTQKVYQVDDSPRYSGSATWVHYDNKTYWENESNSPLPRREYSKRDDYNLMKRGNRQELTKEGWIHEQDNKKIIQHEDGSEELLVMEKGYNTYEKVDDEKCEIAKDWWSSNKKYWAKVRKIWDDIYAKSEVLELKKSVDGMPLFMHLTPEKAPSKKDIRSTIEKFIVKA